MAKALPALLGLAAALVAAVAAAQEKPQRIVSMNLCTDLHLMQLVEPERIAGVTYLASREGSPLAAQADDLPVTYGVAEEVIARDPDLVLAGVYTTRATVEILRRLDFKVVEFAPEDSLSDIRENIRLMGDAVGEPERAAALIASFDEDLAAAAAEEHGGSRPLWTNYGANGYMTGADSLAADIAHVAGYDVLAGRLGISGSSNVQVGLESLLFEPVDAITLSHPLAAFPSLAEERVRHPALRRYVRDRTVVDIPAELWNCGTPFSIEAVRRLSDALPATDGGAAP